MYFGRQLYVFQPPPPLGNPGYATGLGSRPQCFAGSFINLPLTLVLQCFALVQAQAGPPREGRRKGVICPGPQATKGPDINAQKIFNEISCVQEEKFLSCETEKSKKGRQILCAGQGGMKMTELRDDKAKEKKVVRFFEPNKGARQMFFARAFRKLWAALGAGSFVLRLRTYRVHY